MRTIVRLLTRGVALALVLSTLLVLRSASPAFACSCVGLDRVLATPEAFSAAFVGTVVDAPDISVVRNSVQLVSWKFRVEAVYRGELPAIVEVKAPAWGMSCGFEGIGAGSRLGVLLRRVDGSWQSGLCASGVPEKFVVLGPATAPSADIAEETSSSPPATGADVDDTSSSARTLVFAIAGVGIVAALGVVVWLRRRTPVQ